MAHTKLWTHVLGATGEELDKEIHDDAVSNLAETLNLVQDIISRLDRISNSDEIDGLLMRTDMVKRRVVNLGLNDSLTESLNRAHNLLPESEIDANPPRHGLTGRPSLEVNKNQIRFLLEQNFKVAEINRIIGVGKRTLERRMNSFWY